jgi:hypothetical protein
VFRTVSRELAIVGVAYLTFALAKNLTDPSPALKAVSNGWGVIRLESALALNHESFIQQIIARLSLGLLIALTYFYAVGMWLGLAGTAVVLFIKTRVAYVQLRRTFMLTMILGAVVFAVYPLAPPRFMPGLGMTDTVTLLGLDPAAPNSNSAISYNRFAAMPSLHYAWALLVMVAAFRFGGHRVIIAGFSFQLLMFVAIIATANHYILDALAGALLLVIAMYIARQWERYESNIAQLAARVLSLRETEMGWRERVRQFEMPDLRGPFIMGSTIPGGHMAPPARASIAAPVAAPAGTSPSFGPVFDDLGLVLP